MCSERRVGAMESRWHKNVSRLFFCVFFGRENRMKSSQEMKELYELVTAFLEASVPPYLLLYPRWTAWHVYDDPSQALTPAPQQLPFTGPTRFPHALLGKARLSFFFSSSRRRVTTLESSSTESRKFFSAIAYEYSTRIRFGAPNNKQRERRCHPRSQTTSLHNNKPPQRRRRATTCWHPAYGAAY